MRLDKAMMVKRENIENIEKKIALLFKILYISYVFIGINSFLYQSFFVDYFTALIMVVGLYLVFLRVKYLTKELIFLNGIALILFFVSYILSALVNFHYGIIGNIKGGVWLFLQISLLYICIGKMGSRQIKSELNVIFITILVWTGLDNLFSLVLLLQKKGGLYQFENGKSAFYGIVNGRLWGAYIDPNHGAIVTVIALLICLYYLIGVSKTKNKILLILGIIINLCYLAFSDSRTGLVSAIVGIASFFIPYFWTKYHRKIAYNILFSILIIIITSFGILLLTTGIKRLYNISIQVETAQMQESQNNVKVEDKNEENSEVKYELGRAEEIEHDISNRRFDIWKSGLEVFKENILFGVSYRNIVQYTQENLPETYIVNNDMRVFDSFHNMFVDLIASQGIFGVITFLLFVVLTIKTIIKSLIVGINENVYEMYLLIACLFSLASGAFFISAILYVNTPHTIIFWCMLGYLLLICDNILKCKVKGNSNAK